MADPLREKFAELVEEWRKWCGSFTPQQGSYDQGMVRGYTLAADQISALLAESEPEPVLKLGHEFTGQYYGGPSGTCGLCIHPVDGRVSGFRQCGQPRSAHEAK